MPKNANIFQFFNFTCAIPKKIVGYSGVTVPRNISWKLVSLRKILVSKMNAIQKGGYHNLSRKTEKRVMFDFILLESVTNCL